MFFMTKVDACYEKYQSELRKMEPGYLEYYDLNPFRQKEAQDWREHFTREMLMVYPQLREYCSELEVMVIKLQWELWEAQRSKEPEDATSNGQE